MGVQGARPPLGGPGGRSPPEEIEFQRFEMQNMPSPGLKDDVLRVIQQYNMGDKMCSFGKLTITCGFNFTYW